MQSQKRQNDLCFFQGKPLNITVIQVYAPTSNAEEAEVEQFYADLQDLLEPTPKKDILFIMGDWRRKRQPTPVLLPGQFHGQRSQVGYSPWRHEESDMTD